MSQLAEIALLEEKKKKIKFNQCAIQFHFNDLVFIPHSKVALRVLGDLTLFDVVRSEMEVVVENDKLFELKSAVVVCIMFRDRFIELHVTEVAMHVKKKLSKL